LRLTVKRVYHIKSMNIYCLNGIADGVVRVGMTASTEDRNLTIRCNGISIVERWATAKVLDEIDITIDEPSFPLEKLIDVVLIGES
jgi:hypothetical protein